MTRSMLSEWNSEELIYVEPTQVVRSFGYERSRKRTPETLRAIQNSAARAEEADQRPERPSSSAIRNEII